MGDRAYMEVVCQRKDVGRFEDLGCCEGEWTERLPDDVAFLIDSEANYGHDSELRRLAAEGIVFCARHDQGGDYDAAVIASNGTIYCSVTTVFGDGRPHVAVRPEGTIDAEQIRIATEYYLVEAAAREVLGLQNSIFSG